MSTQKRLYTIDEFDGFISLPQNAERRFELVHGEIVEKVPPEEHGVIAGNFFGFIWNFNREYDLGRVAVEPRHQIPGDEHNARLPDVAFTSKERAMPVVKKGAVPQMPDLVIEIKSPDDKLILLREKAAYYLANGTRLVWLVYPEKQLIEIYRPGEDVEILTSEDTLDGGDVLPGFTLPVREIFAMK